MRLAGEKLCPGLTSSNASNLTAMEDAFHSPKFQWQLGLERSSQRPLLRRVVHRHATTSKPEQGFYSKRWQDREIPGPVELIPVELIEELRKHTHRPNCQFCFPIPQTREQHMIDHCKSITKRAKLDPTKLDLKTFRSTDATGILRGASMYGQCSTGWATSPWSSP